MNDKGGVRMEISWTPYARDYFKDEEKNDFKAMIEKKIPTFIENNYYRIKPVHQLEKEPYRVFELRMHVGKKDYRVAFAEKNQRHIVCYVSTSLQKERFEKEIKKWVHRNPDYLEHDEIIMEG